MAKIKFLSLLPLFILFAFSHTYAQEIYASVHNGIGGSFVNAKRGLATGQIHDRTNHFSWFGSLEGLYVLPSGYLVGVEFTAHRVYSYRYDDAGINRTTTVITYHPGAIVGIVLQENFYVKAGLNLRAYSNGGVAPGAMAAIDYSIPLNDLFSIPIGLRGDIMIDTPTIVSLNATIGLRFYIDY